MVRELGGEETQNMMIRMMDMFFGSMASEEKKEFMKQMMPLMMERMMEGMSAEDKEALMNSMMQNMLSTMSDRTKQESFNPSEFCPCYNLCKEAFKKQHKTK